MMFSARPFRRRIALLAIASLLGLLSANALMACPFGAESTHRPCCPPARRCPLSKNLQTCPYNVTESKLGLTEQVQVFPLLSASGWQQQVPDWSYATSDSLYGGRRLDHHKRYLSLQVFRI